ncbi:eCIS core domain-containing protein [Streptomyces adelaidensis]|uniref:eCIS core domain-containing protein n=1 Tax=Streptomyces adelaidensis TaxID=2796465 RepID=UPI001F1F8B38|nr:DUF4157 domain-containing protein [Streptomyces adelaidensis]
MHSQENIRQPAVGKGRDSARTPSKVQAGGGAPSGLRALQSTAGNAAVVQMLRRAGHLGADQHQHGAGCGHQDTERPAVQRSAVHDVLRSGGQALDGATRSDMESRFGADFSDVRIHNDSAARASAAEVGARAYTSGSHVVIGDGGNDRHTLAHELTHVIQQRQGPVAGTDNGSGLKVSDPSDRFEREAEANAHRVMSASPASTVRDAGQETATAPTSGTPAVQRVKADSDAMDVEEEYSDAEYVDLDYESDAYEETDQNVLRHKYNQYPRQVSENPQPAVGFGKSRLGVRPDLVKSMRQDAQGRALPPLKYRTDNAPLYRYDTRGPDEILAQGFAPRSEKLPRSLRLYQKVLHTAMNGTAYVSTSRSPGDYIPEWAKQSNGDAYRYVLSASGGIDLVATLGSTAFLDQQEVIFWKGIRPEFIDRVEIIDSSKKVKESIKRTDWLKKGHMDPNRMDVD